MRKLSILLFTATTALSHAAVPLPLTKALANAGETAVHELHSENSFHEEKRLLEEDEFDIEEETTPFHWSLLQYIGDYSIDLATETHKDFWPLDTSDYIGIFAAIIGLMIASGGGIGGGGILVPIYVLILGFDPKLAVPLSNVTILGGSVANMIINNTKRHPQRDIPLVNWDLILVMEPPTIGGAIIGSILNKFLPAIVIVICLVVVLSIIGFRSLNTGFKLYGKESRELAREKAEQSEKAALVGNSNEGEKSDKNYGGSESEKGNGSNSKTENFGSLDEKKGEEQEEISEELAKVLEQEKRSPIWKIAFLTGFFFCTLGLELTQKSLTCGTMIYIGCYVATFVWVLIVSAMTRKIVVKEWKHKVEIDYKFLDGDVPWTPRNALLYPSLCSFAGLFAGLFGIGGGIVKGPLMLELGVIPQVASATSACMILYTSFTATISYLALGLLKVDYALFLVNVGFIATAVGQLIILNLVKRFKRSSLIVLSIGSVVALSAVLLGGQSILSLIEGSGTTSTGFCDFSST